MALATIAASGGDYTSLSAWEAAVQGTLTEIQTAECAGFTDTTACVIDGSTTTASFYHRIIPAVGAEARMPWNASGYILGANSNCLTLSDPFIRCERIQVQQTQTGFATLGITLGATPITVDGCVSRNDTAQAHTNFNVGDFAVGFRNCVALGNNTNGFGFRSQAFSVTNSFYNCTSINAGTNFSSANGRLLAKNCLGYGGITADFAGTFLTGTQYNASSDATAPGTNSRISQTFTFVNAAGNDYHLAAGDVGALDFGLNLSADADYPFSVDFDNTTRPATWDIGADEYMPTYTAVLTGTAIVGITEGEVVAGGKTIIATLTGATWIPE